MITVSIIQQAVCRRYGLDLNGMKSPDRSRRVARPRQMAMYLARSLTGRSLPDIGRRFGGRDHTTVLHACRNVKKLINTDDDFCWNLFLVEQILSRLERRKSRVTVLAMTPEVVLKVNLIRKERLANLNKIRAGLESERLDERHKESIMKDHWRHNGRVSGKAAGRFLIKAAGCGPERFLEDREAKVLPPTRKKSEFYLQRPIG